MAGKRVSTTEERATAALEKLADAAMMMALAKAQDTKMLRETIQSMESVLFPMVRGKTKAKAKRTTKPR